MQTTDRQIGSVYRKSLYREYTDDTFTELKPRPPEWEHLGMLGPLIRAVVGDTIVIHFKNNTEYPASMHPHGVLYGKDSEGAPYNDGTTGSDKDDDAVPPGGTYVYTWQVPERAGPGPGDGSSVLWVYHSHVNEIKDVNSGLVGPIIITARGMVRADGSPVDVDREFVAMFSIIDENESWYLGCNAATYIGRPLIDAPPGAAPPANQSSAQEEAAEHGQGGAEDQEDAQQEAADRAAAHQAEQARAKAASEGPIDPHDDAFFEDNLKHSINGYIFSNLPGLVMHRGETVRWYVFDMGNEADVHSPHWHGNTLVTVGGMGGMAGGMRTDMTQLLPGMMTVMDMVPDAVGTWLFHCHVNDHLRSGMQALYLVLP